MTSHWINILGVKLIGRYVQHLLLQMYNVQIKVKDIWIIVITFKQQQKL